MINQFLDRFNRLSVGLFIARFCYSVPSFGIPVVIIEIKSLIPASNGTLESGRFMLIN